MKVEPLPHSEMKSKDPLKFIIIFFETLSPNPMSLPSESSNGFKLLCLLNLDLGLISWKMVC